MFKVLKFGGSSVATTELIESIAKYLRDRISKNQKLIVVVSAMGKDTDGLVDLAKSIDDEVKGRELDQLLSTGEIKTMSLLTMSLNKLGVKAMSLSAKQAGIFAEGDYQNAKIQNINTELIMQKFKENDVLVIAGFQGFNSYGDVVTLGRGGSDTSAVALACALGVECEIYTDVDGVYSTDPKHCKHAKKLDYISYDEMIELSALGAKVMHNRSIMLAKKYNIDVCVSKSLSDKKGSRIMNKNKIKEENIVTAITVESDVLSVCIKIQKNSLVEKKIFKLLKLYKIDFEMVSQVMFEDDEYITFVCLQKYKKDINNVLDELQNNKHIVGISMNEYEKLSLVGYGFKEYGGIVNEVFNILNQLNIKYYKTTTADISMSILIDKENSDVALKNTMKEFGVEQ